MVTFKLNVYEGKTVIKTFECKSYDISFGTLEDLMSIAENPEKNRQQIMSFVKPMLFDMFPDLTDEYLRKIRAKDVFALIGNAITYAVNEMGSTDAGGAKGKNG
jgi:hypothetical protein